MSLETQIQEQLNALRSGKVQTFPAKVISVDKLKKTVQVCDVHGIEYPARLSAVVADGDKVVMFPKADTWVLVSGIENQENILFVSAFSEVEEIEGKIGKTEYTINGSGYKINRDGENLKEVLNDYIAEFGKLCDELAKVVVSIGVSPNVPVIQEIKTKATVEIKQRFNKILTA